MNLVEVEIENYRQFQGPHTFRPGQQSMVAVIGRNGAGKTTLFEAIEWCLYNPSTVRSSDLINRTLGGRPRVRVTLEHPQTGEQFEIERQYRGHSTVASVHRSSQPGNPVVQGTRQVSDYVARHVLGLSHSAFVATFFTRQKELSFFGTHTPTERRREVGRLLGLETIRTAQAAIGEQRQNRQNEAKARQSYYDEQSQRIDFAARRQELDALIDARSQAVAMAETAQAAAGTELEEARKALSDQQTRSQVHGRLQVSASGLNGTIGACSAELLATRRSLADIEQAQAECETLQPVAAREPHWQERMRWHDQELAKQRRIDELSRRISQLDASEEQANLSLSRARDIIAPLPQTFVSIREDGPPEPQIGIAELLIQARSTDANTAEQRVNKLVECGALDAKVREGERQLVKYATEVDAIRQRIAMLMAEGDPRTSLQQIELRHAALVQQATTAGANAESARKRRDTTARLCDRLSSGDFTERCPTCNRPFVEGELQEYVDSLNSQIAALDSELSTYQESEAAARRESDAVSQMLDQTRRQALALQEQETRLANSQPFIDDAQLQLDTTRQSLAMALTGLGCSEPPTESEIEAARQQSTYARAAAAQIPLLERLGGEFERIAQERELVGQELDALGPSAYDPNAHRADAEQWDQAKSAQTRIIVLEQRIATRPGVLESLAAAQQREAEARQHLLIVEQQVAALDFRPEVLEEARDREAMALEQFNQAVKHANLAIGELKESTRDLDDLDKLEQQLLSIRDAAMLARREADDLDRMYREFNRFEQYVAQTITPALAELTSELTGAVTDGKYERIEMTDDFGIEVYDGADDHFPLSQFSGGERDVIALCARLALSQLVGSQAQSPLQFVVMDEVFGSLDQDRRQNLMGMLQKLIDETGVFRQLFVISHVDDVQSSPAFDEVWRVTERADGASVLEPLSAGSLPEDM